MYASSGNRTRAAIVAGEHSTTEPTMLDSKFALGCQIILRWTRKLDLRSFYGISYRSTIVKTAMSAVLRMRFFILHIRFFNPLDGLPIINKNGSFCFFLHIYAVGTNQAFGRGSERRRSERRQAKNFRTSKWSF